MTHLWKDEPKASLVDALFRGHVEATKRNNISTVVLQAAYAGSGDFSKSVVAAISSLGGTHAPIMQAYDTLKSALPWKGLYDDQKIAGWGNSFVKGKPDELWKETREYISSYWHSVGDKIDWMTNNLHKEGKLVYPNAACYTAATAIIIGLPRQLSPWLVIQARLPVWAQIIHDTTRQSPTQKLRHN